MRKVIYLVLAMMLNSCTYASNRGRDLGDVFNLSITEGFCVTGHASCFYGALGIQQEVAVVESGHGYLRKIHGNPFDLDIFEKKEDVSEVGCLMVSAKRVGLRLKDETRDEGMSGLFLFSWLNRSNLDKLQPEVKNKLIHRCFGQIEAGATLGFGAKIGFNISELVDFFGGIFGADILDDDANPETEPAQGANQALSRSSRSNDVSVAGGFNPRCAGNEFGVAAASR